MKNVPSSRSRVDDNLRPFLLDALLQILHDLLIAPRKCRIQLRNRVLGHMRFDVGDKIRLDLGPLGVEQLGEDWTPTRLLGLFGRMRVNRCWLGRVDRVGLGDPAGQTSVEDRDARVAERLVMDANQLLPAFLM
jgi:hypothetical protein